MKTKTLTIPKLHTGHDATSMVELQALLRNRLQHLKDGESLRAIGHAISVSHTYLSQLRDGRTVNMHILNRLANYFGYRYYLENYDEDDL